MMMGKDKDRNGAEISQGQFGARQHHQLIKYMCVVGTGEGGDTEMKDKEF